MHRRCASWLAEPLHTFVCLTRRRRARHKVLHKTALPDEAAPVFISLRRGKPFHSAMKHCSVSLHNMKHSAFAPYDEKMKNESLLPENALIRIKSPKFSAVRGHQTSLYDFFFFTTCIYSFMVIY